MNYRYDPETHTYYANDTMRPSVTQILQSCGLTDLSRIPSDILERARIFGDATHSVTSLYDTDNLDLNSVDPFLIPYLNSWKKFRKDTGIKFIQIEQRLDSEKYRFAGRPDRIGIISGKTTVIDIKSGSVARTTGLQLAGYAIMWDESNPRNKIKQRWAVQLVPNDYKIVPYPDINDYDNFKTCVRMFYIQKKYGGGNGQ